MLSLPFISSPHLFRSSVLFRLWRRTLIEYDTSTMDPSSITLDKDNETHYKQLIIDSGIHNQLPIDAHRVLVVHPKIRWGPKVRFNTTHELRLQEAVALVNTVPRFSTVSAVMVGTDYNTDRTRIWGEGRLMDLLEHKNQHGVTAMMINVEILSPVQQRELVDIFRLPIYDRYNIVLLIFKAYARTVEAHLQIALAEIPYIRHRLQHLAQHGGEAESMNIGQVESLSRSGKDPMEVLRLREHNLQKRIKAVIEERSSMVARQTKQTPIPVIAIVGYTNAGKTSLIKRLTGSERLQPLDRLFATLDASLHLAVLPSRIRIHLADTIGFISDLPIKLLASFSATLSDVRHAQLLVHIRDVSHPDHVAQREQVLETLRNLKLNTELVDNMLEVCNKVDKLNNEERGQFDDDKKCIPISCTTGEGVEQLIRLIDQRLMITTGTVIRRFKLRPESAILLHLYKEKLIIDEPEPSNCGHFLSVTTAMNHAQFAKLKAKFPELKRKDK